MFNNIECFFSFGIKKFFFSKRETKCPTIFDILALEDIFKFINFPAFIISLAIGFFFVYVLSKPEHIIYVYPTENNQNHIQYLDKVLVISTFDLLGFVLEPLNSLKSRLYPYIY